MNYLLWLLLPVAAVTGWLVALLQRLQKSKTFFLSAPDYIKGLNYLLNEEPDKAIDIFIKLIDVDSETVETHLALGVLFRRRGEVNRAIRIHQNIIKRPTLHLQQRNLALFELGQDYQSAGLLDRAEDLFNKLVVSDTHQVLALRKLLEIYQQEQDWDKAIHTAQKLAGVSSEPMHRIIAQFYCEQTEDYQQQGQYDAAWQAIQQALKSDPLCVRASLLEGQLALEKGSLKKAIFAFLRVEQQDPDYLTEIIEPLQICYQEIGQVEEFIQYLHIILARYGGITPVLVLATIIKQQKGERAAADFIIKQMHSPSLLGINRLLDLALSNTDCITRDYLLLFKEITTQLLKNKQAYKCNHCGFMVRKLHWQCPSCKQWNTLKPIQDFS